jgi:hypothetical protein
MNRQSDIRQAFQDFYAGKFGGRSRKQRAGGAASTAGPGAILDARLRFLAGGGGL